MERNDINLQKDRNGISSAATCGDSNGGDSKYFPIAIIGIGCRMPGQVKTPKDFWDVVHDGKDCIIEVPKDRWSLDLYYNPDQSHPGTHITKKAGFCSDVDMFDNSFFRISPREATMMDPQQRHLLEVTEEAFEDAGIIPEETNGNVGVYVGIGMMDYPLGIIEDRTLMNSYVHTGVAHSVAANRISYVFNLHGPSFACDTACASSMTSTHLACMALWNKECDMAISAGSNCLFMPEITVGFSALGVLSPDGQCRPFDADAKGYVRSEGWGAVILKPLDKAIQDNDHIYCAIRGTVIGDNGNSQSITMPSTSAQLNLMRTAYAKFGIPPSKIDYIEAHGTGTPVGDPIEAEAIGKAFAPYRNTPLKIGSAKGNFGHMECAAGIVSIIKTALMFHNRKLVPSINYVKPNHRMDVNELKLEVVTKVEKFENRLYTLGVNSFGFGGALAHAIFEEFPKEKAEFPIEETAGWKFGFSGTTGRSIIIPLSAKSSGALTSTAEKWISFKYDLDANAVVGWQSNRRAHHNNRMAVIANCGVGFRETLQNYINNGRADEVVIGGSVKSEKSVVCMVFPGQGQQWSGMGNQLYATETVYRDTVNRCDQVYKKITGFSLLKKYAVFCGSPTEEDINKIECALPSILFNQIALFNLYTYWGIKPDCVIGHSLGEVGAAYACGGLTLEDAVAVIYQRARLQTILVQPGGMAALRATPEEAEKLIAQYNDMYIACINSPGSVTLAGNRNTIAAIEKSNPTKAKQLRVLRAFHTPHMESMKADFFRVLKGTLNPSKTHTADFYSTMTGDLYEGKFDCQYWWDNIRNKVDFLGGTKSLFRDQNIDVFLELGSAATLLSSINQTAREINKGGATLVVSCQRQQDDRMCLLKALSQLYVSGTYIEWKNVNNNLCEWAPIPTYAWQHQSYWTEAESRTKVRLGLVDRTYKGLDGFLSPDVFPYLGQHWVNNRLVLPGAGHIEFMTQLCFSKNDNPWLKNLRFKNPIILEESGKGTHVCSTRTGSVIQLYSDNGNHSSGEVHIVSDNHTIPDILPVDEILSRCPQALTQQQHYSKMANLNLNVGPLMQYLKRVLVGDGEAFGYLAPPENDLERINTCILDSAFQVALAAANLGTTMYIPVRIESLRMFVPMLPVGAPVLVYVKILDIHAIEFLADIYMTKENGEMLVEIKGFQARNVSGSRTGVDLKSCLYTTEWQPKQTTFPSTSSLYEFMDQKRLERLYPDEMSAVKKAETVMPILQKICVTYSRNALSTLLEEETANRNPRWVARLKQVASHNTDIRFEDVHKILDEIDSDIPELNTEIKMLRRMGDLLPEALKDPSVALSVLFAAEHLATYFMDSLTTRLYYKIGSEIIAEAIFDLSKKKKIIRIFEVGGRMGGLARYILRAVQPLVDQGRIDYQFTDHDGTFFPHAQQTLEEYAHCVKYQAFEMEKGAVEQGFVPGTADLLLCLDNLHACANIDTGIQNMKDMVCEGGWLMFYEATNSCFITEVVFGSLALCWVYNDERQDCCWMSSNGWSDALKKNGLDNVVGLSTENEFFHSILIGQKPIAIGSKPDITKNSKWTVLYNTQSNLVKAIPKALAAEKLHCVDISDSISFEKLWNEETNVVYCWDKSDLSLNILLSLAKSIHAAGSVITSFWVLTENGSFDCNNPEGSLAIGFQRVISNEMTEVPTYSVDLDGTSDIDALANQLTEVFYKPPKEERESVVRNNKILIPRVFKQDLIVPSNVVTSYWKLECPIGVRDVDDVYYCELPKGPLASGEVLIKVKAAGVNFKDVMMSMGMLEDLPLTRHFGLECAGIVEKIGSGVRNVNVGDKVFTLGGNCLAAYFVADARLVIPKPSNLSWSEAGGIGLVFVTAYRALVEKANMKRGESILIHSATGGVGQAAIKVAKYIGARIFCTAGSEEKREYLRQECGIQHVANSRSALFAEDIKRWTDGQGVDVVLNSLSGEFLAKGLSVLKPGGRFCEIGKRDMLENSPIYLRDLLRNKSFMSCQVDFMTEDHTEELRQCLLKIANWFETGKLSPATTVCRHIDEYKDTLRWMAKGRHRGKIVLEIPENFVPERIQPSQELFKSDATYIVTGAFGGIGLAISRWLAEKGAKHIAMVSRSGCKTQLQRCTVDHLKKFNTTVYDMCVDVSKHSAVNEMVTTLSKKAPPIKGIFHLAGVIDDNNLSALTHKQLSNGLGAKAMGAWYLHECTKNMDIDLFMMLSSVCTLYGNPEQASYSAGNSFLDALSTYRRHQGLPAVSLQFGAVKGAGYLEDKPIAAKITDSKGVKTLHIIEYLQLMSELFRQPQLPPVVTIANMEWEQTLRFCYKDNMKFRHLVTTKKKQIDTGEINEDELHDKVISKLSEILCVPAEEININLPMTEYGVDSLMAVDMVSWLTKEYDLSVSQLDILGGMTTSTLLDKALEGGVVMSSKTL